MGKKTSTPTKTAVPAKRAAKPTTTAKAAPATIAKANPSRPTAPKSKPSSNGSGFSEEDITLRAYFISEKRRAANLPGNEHQDWLEAERQLLAESRTAAKRKKA